MGTRAALFVILIAPLAVAFLGSTACSTRSTTDADVEDLGDSAPASETPGDSGDATDPDTIGKADWDGQDTGATDESDVITAPDGTSAVPASPFWMGCNAALDAACEGRELPQHLVRVPAYAIDTLVVTNAKIAAFLNALEAAGAGNECPYEDKARSCLSTHGTSEWSVEVEQVGGAWAPKGTRGEHPAIGITWYGARAYCEYAGGRLCSEAEWEKAARGGCETVDGLCQANMRVYPWSDADKSDGAAATCEDAWIKVSDPPPCAPDGPAPVTEMLLDISPYGALQMAGNLREWTEDCYHLDYVGAPTDGVPWTADCESGEGGAAWRVIRGGSYDQAPHAARAASRREKDMWVPDSGTGFRCCKSE